MENKQIMLWQAGEVVLRTQVINWMMRKLPRQGTELGVSPGYMINMIKKYHLTESDLDFIVEARLEYQASMAAIKRFLRDGLTPEQINSLYMLRDNLEVEDCYTVSLSCIIAACQECRIPLEEDSLEKLREVVRSFFYGDPAAPRRVWIALKNAVTATSECESAYNPVETLGDGPAYSHIDGEAGDDEPVDYDTDINYGDPTYFWRSCSNAAKGAV